MNKILIAVLILIAAALGAAGERWLHFPAALASVARSTPRAAPARRVLYWYDPMQPSVHFDHPGKSPSMNMDLLPKYATSGGSSAVLIPTAQSQALGMRLGTVHRGLLRSHLHVSAVVAYDDRQLSVLQARTDGYLEQVVPHTAGDLVRQGELLATLRAPAWTSAQAEERALRHAGDSDLAQAAQQRLRALGMSRRQIQGLQQGAPVTDRIPIRAPRSGVLLSADLRVGMTVTRGQTLARVNGLDSVWLEAAVPQAQAAQIRVGQAATLNIAGSTPTPLSGRVLDILPALNADNRSLNVRLQMPNADHRLHPGMYGEVDLLHTDGEHLLVPSAAILNSGQRTLVFLAQGSGRYLPVEVRVGSTADGMSEILQGLQAGDQVVVSGQFLLDSEAKLNDLPIRPLAPPAAAEPTRKAAAAQHQTRGMADMGGM